MPSTVLDNIFSEENDVKILENAFRSLVEDGFKEDDALIFKIGQIENLNDILK